MKTMVIVAHPNLENSRVNQRWKEALLQYPNDITLHEIYKEYPDWNIDIPREQNLMEAYDHVIFQFPLYWYSYPPFQASDEEINTSAKEYIHYIFKYHI
ncbi:NAD(P)H-dependent oxidoreductase [Paenibacillus sp. FSL R5-0470]|uniref:NAD(P)H-dependent oxidoreductase n=1 Tax=Paenibacillus sp. FSL R5-0470 TaxID=2921641 RepID=UPI0030D7D786